MSAEANPTPPGLLILASLLCPTVKFLTSPTDVQIGKIDNPRSSGKLVR
jgi:hypothetical protein